MEVIDKEQLKTSLAVSNISQMRIQDLPGYPNNLDLQEIMEGDWPEEEIRDWVIDLLAFEAEPWLDYENEVTAHLARSVIAACRPMMEAMAMTRNALEADQGVLQIIIGAQLAMSRALIDLKRRRLALGLEDPEH